MLPVATPKQPMDFIGLHPDPAVLAGAAATLVQRTSRRLMLINLSEHQSASAADVVQGSTDKLLSIVSPMRQSITCNQLQALAQYKQPAKHRYRRVLLRPAQPSAMGIEREHQWTSAAVTK